MLQNLSDIKFDFLRSLKVKVQLDLRQIILLIVFNCTICVTIRPGLVAFVNVEELTSGFLWPGPTDYGSVPTGKSGLSGVIKKRAFRLDGISTLSSGIARS